MTPLWPIVEKPAPADSDVPGEKPYPTQPFPTKPPAFVDQGVTLEDANDLTPEIKAMAQDEMKKYRLGPLYTPPSLRGTLQSPSQGGGASWGGASFDPDSGYLFVRAAHSIGRNRVAQERRHRPAGRCGLLERVRTRRRRNDPAGNPAEQAAIRRADRHRSQDGRHRVEGAARRRQRGAAQQSAAERRGAARSARLAKQPGRRAGSQERSRVHRRRRHAISTRSTRWPAKKSGAGRCRTRTAPRR